MASRRRLDADILGKMGGGLVMMAIPASVWYFNDSMSRGAWFLGVAGVFVFVWGLASIGDRKSEWDS